MANCVEEVAKAFPEADRKDIETIYKSMSEARAKAFLDGMGNPDSAFRQKSVDILENYRKSVANAKTEAVNNILVRKRAERFISNPVFKDKSEGLRAMMGGTFKKIEGGRRSIDTRGKAIKGTLQTALLRELDLSPGLRDIYLSGDLDRQVMQEIYDLAKGGKGGISGSMEAAQIGKAVHKINKMELKVLNESGAFINELDGYIMRQSHDVEELKRFGRDAWIEKITPLLDHEKTFNRDFFKEDARKYLEAVFDEIVANKPKILQSEASDQLLKIVGTPSNLAKKLSQGRRLHFKDANAFYEYNTEFGKRTLSEQVNQSIQATSRSAAMLQSFGTNPRATFERLTSDLDKPAKERLERYWREIDGTTSIPGHSPLARYGQTIRMVNDMAKLPLSMVSSFGDIMTRAAVLNVNGENILSAHMQSFTSIFENLTAAQKREALELTAINADSILGDMFSQNFSTDGAAGKFAKAHKLSFKVNGLHGWTEASKAGTAQRLSRRLGINSGKSFSELDPGYARNLQNYDIGPVEWELIRNSVESDYGVSMVGFSKVLELPNDMVASVLQKGGHSLEGLSPKQIEKFAEKLKSETSQKLASYFNDQVSIAMNEAGVRERAEVLRRGTLNDSVDGQVMRFFAQFKSYPVTMVTKFWDMMDKQVLAERQGLAAKTAAIAPLLVSSTLLGYTSLAAKEMLKGRTPPDPFDPGTMLKAATQGGALGIYGDFIFGEYDSRMGRSALSAIAGPTFGQMDDIWNLKQRITEEDKPGGKSKGEKVFGQAWRMIWNNAPIGVLKTGINLLFMNEINETLNPGYRKRMKKRLEETGQDFLLDGGGA